MTRASGRGDVRRVTTRIDRSPGRPIDRPIARSPDRPIARSIARSIDRSIDRSPSTARCADARRERRTGTRTSHRHARAPSTPDAVARMPSTRVAAARAVGPRAATRVRAATTRAKASRVHTAARDADAAARATLGAALAALAVTTTCVPGLDAARATATATATATTAFAGRYADPKHPGCLREIAPDGGVRGEDGDPGCGEGAPTRAWALRGVIAVGDESIFIDFSPKGGPANLVGERVEGGVKFPDGNVWRKLD